MALSDEEQKAKKLAKSREYNARPDIIARRKEYHARLEIVARRTAYQARPEVKAKVCVFCVE